jgi:hypothetical protein
LKIVKCIVWKIQKSLKKSPDIFYSYKKFVACKIYFESSWSTTLLGAFFPNLKLLKLDIVCHVEQSCLPASFAIKIMYWWFASWVILEIYLKIFGFFKKHLLQLSKIEFRKKHLHNIVVLCNIFPMMHWMLQTLTKLYEET